MVAIGAIASAIGIALALWINWFPADAAKQDKPIDTLYDVLMIVSIPIFVLVMTVILYSAWAFRMRPGQEKEDGPPIHGNTRLEVFWTAIPAIILVSLCSYAYAVLNDIEKVHADELVVKVHAIQFAWSFEYPQANGRPVVSNQLYLPKDKPVRFDIDSQDVLHDFWVPAFRVKIDAVPGITTRLRATPTRIGIFPVVCAELCGLGHSVMRSTAHVLSPAAFDRWLASEKAPAVNAGGGGGRQLSQAQLIALGRTTFIGDGGCGACHTLADAGTTGTTGPDLDRVLPGMSEDEIRTDIVDPNATIAPGYQANIMPPNFSQTLSSQQLDGLVAYLATVSK
ncbi:MAG TPA: cytochrome c oxidase subunit II [Conexibacter sp.]|jgi:cytochrome c oxidase subunit 2|nr:cytochrome c oxidase subunit II [Conexibacter sp.]